MPFDLLEYLSMELSEYLAQVVCESFESNEAYLKDMNLIKEIQDSLSKDLDCDAPYKLLIDAMLRQEGRSRDVVYWQGWRDCVKLLQLIGLLDGGSIPDFV